MDQIASHVPLTFVVVPFPSGVSAVTLAFQNGRLLGQLSWKGWAPQYRHQVAIGEHVLDGKVVYYASGPYGEVEVAEIEPASTLVLRTWNGGAK